jgi:HPt (histidine-containing phosphotransfer) domain-containing protein
LLHIIAARALRSNLSRVADLTEAVKAGVSGELDAAVRRAAAEAAHQLVGSAGTFGYARASVLARELESYFSGRSVVTENDWAAAFRTVQTLGEVLQAGPDADNEEEDG